MHIGDYAILAVCQLTKLAILAEEAERKMLKHRSQFVCTVIYNNLSLSP
jgi:hypothetical protein